MNVNSLNRMASTLVPRTFTLVGMATEENPVITVKHNSCGHVFTVDAVQLARTGIVCHRCSVTHKNNVMYTLEEQHALEIYNKCESILGTGCTITGDTSDVTNTIHVVRKGKEFDIVIQDLFKGINLPDYLVTCNVTQPSLAMQILQKFKENHYMILSDFQTLTDTVSVKDLEREEIFEIEVSQLLTL